MNERSCGMDGMALVAAYHCCSGAVEVLTSRRFVEGVNCASINYILDRVLKEQHVNTLVPGAEWRIHDHRVKTRTSPPRLPRFKRTGHFIWQLQCRVNLHKQNWTSHRCDEKTLCLVSQ